MATEMRFDASKWFKILSGPILPPQVTSCPKIYRSRQIPPWTKKCVKDRNTRSSAKFLWQCLQGTRSSRGFGAKTDRRVAPGVCSKVGVIIGQHYGRTNLMIKHVFFMWTFLLAAGEGGTGFFLELPPPPPPPPPPPAPLISMLTELFGFTFLGQ